MTTPPPGATVAADPQIALRIKGAIKDNKTSLLALSNETGIAYPTLRRSIEGGIKGHRSLTVCELGAIASVLHIKAADLIEDDSQ